MQDDATLIRDWLNEVMRRTGLKPTPLARRAGLAPSTLIRALDADNPSMLERRSITKIVQTFGVPEPSRDQHPGLADDLLPYDAEEPPHLDALNVHQYRRIVGSQALDLIGYLPGDVLTLDMSETPIDGDAVDAQVYDRSGAETVLRYYDPPYLVTRTTQAALSAKPLLVDGERVRIAAVVVHAQRWSRQKIA